MAGPEPAPPGPPATVEPILAAAAVVLLDNGQTTEGARLAVERLSRVFGAPVRLQARWGEFTLHPAHGPATAVHAAAPAGVDIGRVIAAEAVVDAVCAGRLAPADAPGRLDAAGRRPPVPLARFAPMAAAGAAALGVIFGARDGPTLLLIAIVAGAGAVLRRAVSHIGGNPFLQPLAAALLAGIAGGTAARLGLPVALRLVAVCPCMVLVPGPHFLNGAIDLLRARIPLGAARLALAGLVVTAICAGLLAGLALVGAPFPQAGAAVPVPLVADVLAAGVAVAAYGSFFNMPWRLLGVPVVLGMAGHALRWVLLAHGASLPLGAFAASLLVGVAIAPLSHRLRLPFGASAFASVVSLIPGVFMFQAASGLQALAALGTRAGPEVLPGVVADGATAGLVLLAMTAGLILPKIAWDHVARPCTA